MANQAPAPYSVGYASDTPTQQHQQQPAQQWPGYPQQPAYYPSPPQDQVIGECESCKGKIKLGEPVIEMFEGVAGVSPQTGQMLAEAPPNHVARSYTVHKKCAIECAAEMCPDEADDALYEMANEMANDQMDAFLEDRGLGWDELIALLENAGYRSESAQEDENYARKVNGGG